MKFHSLCAGVLCAALLASPLSGCSDTSLIDEFFGTPVKYRAAESVVFAGDSITELCELEKYYPDYTVVNCGKCGDNSIGLLSRIKSVCANKADVYVLLIGVNDLTLFGESVGQATDGILTIVSQIHSYSRNSAVIVQSVYPVNTDKYGFSDPEINKNIKLLNERVRLCARDFGFIWCDTAAVLRDESGMFIAEYTDDGLHPNDAGYTVISQTVGELLAKVNVRVTAQD